MRDYLKYQQQQQQQRFLGFLIDIDDDVADDGD